MLECVTEQTRAGGRARLFGVLGSAGLGVAALSYVALVDPHRPGALFPVCPFRLLTGWNCPACGGLRMTHDLLHGDLAAAASDNIFLLIGIPLLAAWSLWRIRLGQRVLTTTVLVIGAIAAVGWTVVRNLPGFPLVPTMLGP